MRQEFLQDQNQTLTLEHLKYQQEVVEVAAALITTHMEEVEA